MKDCGTERLEPATGDHSSEGPGGAGQGSEGPERGLGPGSERPELIRRSLKLSHGFHVDAHV